MEFAATSQIDSAARPAMVSEYALSADSLRRRGAVLAGEALADWPLLLPDGRGLSAIGGTVLTMDGLRLAPAPDGRLDLSLLPLTLLDGARLSVAPAGVAQGAGALGGVLDLALAPADAGNRAWALGGAQAGTGIGGIDLRLGDQLGWLAGGFTRGGALPGTDGLAAGNQQRWHLAGRFRHQLGGVTLWGRGLFASRQEAGSSAQWHDVALGLAGGTRWQWRVSLASGGQQQDGLSSQLGQARAVISGPTGLVLPGASEPISLAAGAEWRRLRLAATTVTARDLFAEAAVPVLQDRPAAENLVATLGLRQSWLAGRSEPLWQAGLRWEMFPGIALRGQLARGLDELATTAGIGRSLGLIATPAFLPGLAVTLDRRWQTLGPGRLQALDMSASWRGRITAGTQLVLAAMATHHDRAEQLAQPLPRFASLLRATLETGPWAFSAGWRHRSPVAGARLDGLDLAVERQLGERLRLVASLGNAANANSAAGPVGRQALLQLVAGF